jgi:hypothetical protein
MVENNQKCILEITDATSKICALFSSLTYLPTGTEYNYLPTVRSDTHCRQ